MTRVALMDGNSPTLGAKLRTKAFSQSGPSHKAGVAGWAPIEFKGT